MKYEIQKTKIKELQPKPIRLDDTVEFEKYALPKGKYDIHYVIQLCRIIEEKCEKMKHCTSDLRFSLQNSLQRLIAYLETERDNPSNKCHVVHLTCERCGCTDIIFAKNAKEHVCQCQTIKK